MRCASLISLCLLALPVQALDANFGGFVYGTWFSQPDWHDHEARAAVNADITHGNFALRTQITTQANQPRRLLLEYSRPVSEATSATVQAGRLVRLDGFYNNVTDSPSSSGMSLLPLAVYNRRMNTGTFTIMDGVQLTGRTTLEGSHLEYGIRAGKAFIDSEEDLQKEAFGRVVSTGIETDPQFDNYDAYVRWERRDTSYLLSINRYATDFKSVAGNPMDDFLVASMASDVTYTTAKVGASHQYGKLNVSAEYHYGIVNTHDRAGKETFEKRAHNGYVRVGYDLRDCLDVYATYNYGRTVEGDSEARDAAIGVTWDRGDWMVNLEYHKGNSTKTAWSRYGSGVTDWDSAVVSVVRRF